jgi:hypothetical protein
VFRRVAVTILLTNGQEPEWAAGSLSDLYEVYPTPSRSRSQTRNPAQWPTVRGETGRSTSQLANDKDVTSPPGRRRPAGAAASESPPGRRGDNRDNPVSAQRADSDSDGITGMP